MPRTRGPPILYAGLDVAPRDRELFYSHTGHAAEVNAGTYQRPLVMQAILTVRNSSRSWLAGRNLEIYYIVGKMLLCLVGYLVVALVVQCNLFFIIFAVSRYSGVARCLFGSTHLSYFVRLIHIPHNECLHDYIMHTFLCLIFTILKSGKKLMALRPSALY